MSTSWSLTAQEVCTDALEHLGVIASGETANADDMNIALRGLDAVLKELPVRGYNWPKLSDETAVTWTSSQTVNLPVDYYGYASVWKTSGDQRVKLTQIPHSKWEAMTDRFSATGEPTHFYVSSGKVLYFYPTPTADPVAYLQYQKIVDDSALTVSPDVLQIWLYPLGYGVANEIGLKFGIDPATRIEISQRWAEKRELASQSSVASEPISVTVDD